MYSDPIFSGPSKVKSIVGQLGIDNLNIFNAGLKSGLSAQKAI